ncbi:hypothetical protein SERLA73DRAFT_110504 [Serpula lacrymans var. lacrymans S7.3]|uniref:CN hydrolase domain-containing protein n=2 Tax=Serpula lacrymans var. lacrymans TaxID=341189 RepID=F8Q298_SERL3|nr:hypothetical protein SERLA73DRAFT_110504 [Serpula lacrymans var. lacrymans S7.3]
MFAISVDVLLAGRVRAPWARMTLFPTIWALVWSVASHTFPLGRLLSWSPASSSHPYTWMLGYTGPAGIDWIVGAWAVLGSELAGRWLMGRESLDDLSSQSLIHHPDPDATYSETAETSTAPASRKFLPLGAFLFAFSLPSIFAELPRRPYDSSSTPLMVGCVLPTPTVGKHLSLDDYISTSATMTEAKVLLWPETAVMFNSPEERELAFEKIRKVPGPLIGVPFEEYVPDSDDTPDSPNRRTGSKRNGLALISSSQKPGDEIVQYYKRNLVPIAESFSMTPSVDPPTIYNLNLTHPKGITAPSWSPLPDHIRPIPITTSICFDFASPTAFSDLPSRPALILAPARTWDTAVSLAMWEQAKTRAAESGSMVLWCDGGAGGVSGIGGQGIGEIMQVGAGSWKRYVGVQWPFDERKTVYAAVGESEVLAFLVLLMGSGSVGSELLTRANNGNRILVSLGQAIMAAIPAVSSMLRRNRKEPPNLIDIEDEGERRPLLN